MLPNKFKTNNKQSLLRNTNPWSLDQLSILSKTSLNPYPTQKADFLISFAKHV